MKIIEDALKVIDEYCLSDCTAECCKSGKTLKEIDVVLDPCKHLKNDLCSIHNKRPQTCRDYPIRKTMLGDKEIVIIGKCKAVDNGLIDEHIKEIEKLGFKIYK